MKHSPLSKSDTTNMIMALALSLLVLLWWEYSIEGPRRKVQEQAARRAHAEMVQREKQQAAAPATVKTRAQLLGESPRLRIVSDHLHGSVALKGLRFDDLTLARYHETLDPASPEAVLFSPAGTQDAYFATFGWPAAPVGVTPMRLPDAQTVWTADAPQLTPQQPVTLTWNNGEGVTFTVRIALDAKYMFTLTQSARDAAGKPVKWWSYASISRVYDMKKHMAINILHEGPIGVFNGTLKEATYKTLTEEKAQNFEAQTGWLGMSDKYWLSAIIPPAEANDFHFVHDTATAGDRFQADYLSPPREETTVRFFAGAKELAVLDAYAAQHHIPLFDRAVDFGIFYFLTKPIFLTLNYFYAHIGNFGIAILLLTVIVKLLMYPLANKSYRSMNQLKELQPKIKAIQERAKDDKTRLNQDMIALYKREGVNPAAGCLPMLIQIPVFFSLYKVLYVSIEMRHAPFFGWIHDLSAPDPTNLFTLFGLFPWNHPALLHLGAWPILMCVTMVIQQFQSPPPPDPVQAKIMKLLPFFFLFLFSGFAAGLVIYWTWSNTLSILQQWHIKRKYAKKPDA